MPYRIEVTEGPQEGESYPLDEARGSIIGRSPTNNIFLIDRSVSRAHCQILVDAEKGECRVEDLGSTNGTFVNGERITEKVVNEGDTIRVGVYALRLVRYLAGTTDPTTMIDEPTSKQS